MKYNLFFIILTISTSCKSQESNRTEFTYENFDAEFFNYSISKKETVLEKDYQWAKLVISQTHKALKNDVANYNIAHYWNIMTALDVVKEDIQILKIVLKKLAESKGNCTYIINFKDKVSFDETLPELYNKYYLQCKSNLNKSEPKEFNIENYISGNKLNPELVRLFQKIDSDDQKYRSADENTFKLKQPGLDRKNELLIDSLFNKYNTYIDKSFVGEKFDFVMWSVIQHSSIEMMEKYLPIIHKAVEDKELDVVPLKMLIDRFYGLKYGYQIFGSQNGFGFEMADEKTRKKIELKYGIE